MPAVRTDKENITHAEKQAVNSKKNQEAMMFPVRENAEDLADCKVEYPLSSSERTSFRTKAGKRVTPHQWAIYDYARTIPCGKVTTYKDIATALNEGSPRSVGNALKNNPFAPFVPCHRIVASSLFVGGFFGEWGVGEGKRKEGDSHVRRKMEMLAREGVGFTKDGYLSDREVVWRAATDFR